jgi:hypothetical protein
LNGTLQSCNFESSVSEEKFFLTLANQKQELPLAATFVGGMGRNEEIYRAQQDLTTLKFGRKSDYLSWSYCPLFIKFSKF